MHRSTFLKDLKKMIHSFQCALPFYLTGCHILLDVAWDLTKQPSAWNSNQTWTTGGNHLCTILQKLMSPCLRNLWFCKYLRTFPIIYTKSSYPPKFFSMSLFPPILPGHMGPIPSSHLEKKKTLNRPAVHRGANTCTHRQTHLHSHSGAN